MPPYDRGEILRGVCHERYEIFRFAQNDTHPVIARLTKSAEAISRWGMRLPRFARNDKNLAGTSPTPTNECGGEVYPRLFKKCSRLIYWAIKA